MPHRSLRPFRQLRCIAYVACVALDGTPALHPPIRRTRLYAFWVSIGLGYRCSSTGYYVLRKNCERILVKFCEGLRARPKEKAVRLCCQSRFLHSGPLIRIFSPESAEVTRNSTNSVKLFLSVQHYVFNRDKLTKKVDKRHELRLTQKKSIN